MGFSCVCGYRINVNKEVFLVGLPPSCYGTLGALYVFSAVLRIYKLQEGILGFRQPPSQPDG